MSERSAECKVAQHLVVFYFAESHDGGHFSVAVVAYRENRFGQNVAFGGISARCPVKIAFGGVFVVESEGIVGAVEEVFDIPKENRTDALLRVCPYGGS